MSSFTALPRLLLAAAVAASFAAPQWSRAEDLPPQASEIRALLRTHQFDEAAAKAKAWTTASPANALAWHWSGRVYGQQALSASMFSKPGLASKMQKALEHSLQLDASNVEAHFDLMQFYVMAPGFMGGSSDKANAEAATIARLDPARGHIALGMIAESGEDAKTAESEYRAGVAAVPDEARARVALFNLLAGQKRWADARALFVELLGRKPDDPRALYQLGKLAVLSGEELDAGLAYLDRYLAQKDLPDELPEYGGHWRRAQILEKLGKKDAALAELRVATQLDPSAEGPRKDLKRLGG